MVNVPPSHQERKPRKDPSSLTGYSIEGDQFKPVISHRLSFLEVVGMGLLILSPWILAAGAEYRDSRDPKIQSQKAYIETLEKREAALIAEINRLNGGRR